MEVLEYQTAAGRKPFLEWLEELRDRQSIAVIRNRIKRLRLGHFGDHKYVGDGVWELRIFFGPGFRVYYLLDDRYLVILLLGGIKDSQGKDIPMAKVYADDYWRYK